MQPTCSDARPAMNTSVVRMLRIRNGHVSPLVIFICVRVRVRAWLRRGAAGA
jgi:hypothetical protein